MKKLILSITIAFTSLSLFAQGNYNEAIAQGDEALKKEEYTTAIQKYLIAKEYAPNRIEDIGPRLKKVYTAIENQKSDLNKTKSDLNKTEKLLTAKTKELKDSITNFRNATEQLNEKDNKLQEIREKEQALEEKISNYESLDVKALKQLDDFSKELTKFIDNQHDKNKNWLSIGHPINKETQKQIDGWVGVLKSFLEANNKEKDDQIEQLKKLNKSQQK